MRLKTNSRFAFTLPEVLITLGVISVVAALTLPSLINNNRAIALESGLKKGASEIDQALLKYKYDNSEPIYVNNKIMNYFNVIKDCGYAYTTNSTPRGCVPYVVGENSDKSSKTYKTLNGKSIINLTYFDDRQFILADGSIIFLETYQSYISIDVNGYIKGPNRLGQDLFMFKVNTNGKLIPMGAKGTVYYSENDAYCSKSSTNNMNGAGCTVKALTDPNYFKNL